jgi:O-antigen ligase
MGIMLFAFIGELITRRFSIRQYPWAAWLLLPFCYLLLRNLWGIIDHPELADKQIELGLDWLKLAYFIIAAWFIRGDQRRILIVLVLIFVGFVVGIATAENWQFIHRGAWQHRWGFGFPLIFFGHVCSIGLLGILLFSPRISAYLKNRWLRYTKIVFLMIIAGLLLQGMIISQTRASWLAAILVLPAAILFDYLPTIRAGGYMKRIVVGAVVLIVAVSAVININYKVISSRIMTADKEVQSIVIDDPKGSVGGRYYMWTYGLEKWRERPLLGWGNSTLVLDKLPETARFSWLMHLHNTYIELLVQGGVIALGLFLAVITAVSRVLYNAHCRQLVARDVLAFLAGVLVILLIWMFADYQMFLSRFKFFFIIMFGLMFSYYFAGTADKDGDGDA